MAAFIYDTVRTPRGKGKRGGALNQVTPIHLATTCLQAIRDRNDLSTANIEDVILGCSNPLGEQGGDIGRIAALNAGFDQIVAGVQLDRFCGSGLDAIHMASAYIMAGQIDLCVAGGVESMSRVPMGSGGSAGLMDPQVVWRISSVPQGISADLIATRFGYDRSSLDAFALRSQQKAYTAQCDNLWAKSLVAVKDINGRTLLDKDEYLRPETTMQDLGNLQPAFEEIGCRYGYEQVVLARYPEVEKINYCHHAGNSSGIVDGAAAVLIGSEAAGVQAGLIPRAKVRAWANVGVEPVMMLHGPWPAAQKAMSKAGLTVSDIDLFEVNEAFSSVVLHFLNCSGVNPDCVNVDGGAIALGHPLGATGAMLVSTLIDALEREDKQFGLVTMCAGAGMGVALIIERL
ncbi:MAG: acetyl-CoA C-acetyltransferase [Pseudomonadota bacterium]